jgi:tripartite-type tricarboxylate transporter receptor subunit TctC
LDFWPRCSHAPSTKPRAFATVHDKREVLAAERSRRHVFSSLASLNMRPEKSQADLLFVIFSCAFLIVLFIPDCATSQVPFYKGKTITFINAVGAGGTGDLRGKPIAAFLGRHIPGNPTIVSEYMPGAGGRKAANHMYSVARPDGLTMARISSSMVPNAVLGEAGVRYDLDRFIYLGSAESVFHFVLLTRKDAGLNSLEKLRMTPQVRVAAGPVGHSTYFLPRLFAYLIDMKEPRIVPGYGGAETDIALMRGEVDLRVISTGSVEREWIEKGLVVFHVALEIPKGRKYPGFTQLPELESFVKSEKDRKLLAMVRAFRQTGGPWILPPETPKDRAKILQEAMRKTFADPDFHNEYKKLTGDDATPLLPEELEKVIRDLPRDPETVALFKKFVGGGPLPAR